ncbi:MAG: sigma-70 family RNA polymerase sigma factor [Pirellulales bacterium]
MHADYKSPVLRQLRDQQVGYAPRDKKLEQLNRAEKLLHELDPDRVYTYEFLCQKITDYKPTSFPNHKLNGTDAKHDLLLFVEDLSDSADLGAVEVGENVMTVDELSKSFNVSTKTINRWRQQGLVSRRFVFDGRKRVGFLKSSVDRFVAGNEERIKRGTRFSQMRDDERDEILHAARRLSVEGGCPSEVIRQVAEQYNRSVETVRYTIRNFDQEHTELAIFPHGAGALDDEAKKKIQQQFHRGVSVDSLAKAFCRTCASIYRIVNEMRARRIMELPLDFIPNPGFPRLNPEKILREACPENPAAAKKIKVPAGLPPYLGSLYEIPLLNREQEAHLFRKFNFLKYRAGKLREQLDPVTAKSSTMDEIEKLYNEALAVKNSIVRANLRLVVSIAKKHIGPTDNFFELVSDGNVSLIRAVEKFDFARGFKFSTYASWAIMKNYARSIPDEIKHKDRFRTTALELFLGKADNRGDHLVRENEQNRREKQVGKILERLDEREQKIIISRFGLDHSHEPLTLQEVGVEMGVTKERVRQIEARALDKLRQAIAQEHLDIELPG